VELGVLLDLFVAVFVTSVLLMHMRDVFASMDTRRMTTLQE
jgi:hydrogenase-4 membrane subunit HyfE